MLVWQGATALGLPPVMAALLALAALVAAYHLGRHEAKEPQA